jgi:glutamate/tyrosine decarboxylase-like PLP-dependent enzyme
VLTKSRMRLRHVRVHTLLGFPLRATCIPRAGTSTVGSSEACMLGGLALKMKWKARRQREGKPIAVPNIVMGANVQVVW